VIYYEKAFEGMRAAGYPRPISSDAARRSLSEQAAPLLSEAAQNLLRALQVNQTNSWPMNYLMFVSQAQAYVATTTGEQTRAGKDAAEWTRKVYERLEAEAKAAGRPWPPPAGGTATMTFQAVPGAKVTIPPFPPDPQRMIPLPPPPPPPAAKQ
jgi:hypothetical protein